MSHKDKSFSVINNTLEKKPFKGKTTHKKKHKKEVPFNTLELTADYSENEYDLNKAGTDIKKLKKRANSKYFTDSYLIHLLNIKDSPLKKAYWQTWHCTSVITNDTDNNYFATYCKKRWCIVCARILTAKRIKTYLPVLQEWENKYFVTLTQPNIPGEKLREELTLIIKSFRKILENNRKNYKISIKGTRNIEITYNPVRNDFHPHLHCTVDSLEAAEYIKNKWLEQFPNADPRAQDIRPFGTKATDLLEAFKYSQKILSQNKKGGNNYIYCEAMDTINICTRGGKGGVRLFQTFGFTKPKDAELTPEEETSLKELDKNMDLNEVFIYNYDRTVSDWINVQTGELLTNYEPSESFKDIRENRIIF
jgi:hypothetical protein